MADTSANDPASPSSPPPGQIQLTIQPALIGGILFATYALFTRLWNLGLKSVQHDESMFAYYSFNIFYARPKSMGEWFSLEALDRLRGGYEYMPIMHGPVLEWVTAFFFLIFGDADWSMRLPQALCNLFIMLLIWRLRNDMGKRAAWISLVLLATDPTMTYLSRYIRPDMIMILEYMMLTYAGWRYAQRRTPGRLMGIVILAWIASATHETYVMYFFFVLTFAFGCWLHGLWHGRKREEIPVYREFVHAILRQWWAIIPAMAIGAAISVALMTSFGKFPGHWDGQWEAVEYWSGQHKEHRIKGDFHFYFMHTFLYALPIFLFWMGCMLRTMWPERSADAKPGSEFLPKVLFLGWIVVSIVILNLPAFWSEAKDDNFWNWRFTEIWDHRLHMQMGLHPWIFLNILVIVCVSGWKHLNRGRYFQAFTDYWTVGSYLAYGYAGEKVPWVLAHIMLPMILSAGQYAARIWETRFSPAPAPVPPAPEPGEGGKGRRREAKPAAPLALPAPAGSSLTRTLILAGWGIGFAWTMYVGIKLCFIQPASPIERHSYASSHTEFHSTIRFLIREMDEKYQGLETPIAFEGEPSWPLHWYLRNYSRRAANVTANTDAQFIIIDNKLFESNPPYKDRYVWGRKRFRHYWTPVPLNWESMKRIDLFLRGSEGLSPELRQKRELGLSEWKKFFVAYFLRNEDLTRDGAKYAWNWLGGYDFYVGKKVSDYEAPAVVQPPPPPPPPAETMGPPPPPAETSPAAPPAPTEDAPTTAGAGAAAPAPAPGAEAGAPVAEEQNPPAPAGAPAESAAPMPESSAPSAAPGAAAPAPAPGDSPSSGSQPAAAAPAVMPTDAPAAAAPATSGTQTGAVQPPA